ncbi:MAG: low temperature requirement protein A, partial [Actinomycetota bacterium]|nr:low temperature requirement protein A [Actinomycetota bacterium]
MSEQQVGPRGTRTDRPERHPSWLELFFDLVFVVAVAALARQLHDDHSLTGLAVFAGLFVPVWWAWRGFAWYATGFDTDDRTFRVALLAGMVSVAAVSAGVDGAAHGDLKTFVIAYAGVCWQRCTPARGGGFLRPIWGVAMLLLFAGPIVVLLAPERAYDAAHIAERYGLFTIIVLGESVVVTVSGLDTGGSVAAALVALLGFMIAATIWWVYFGRYRSLPEVDALARFV